MDDQAGNWPKWIKNTVKWVAKNIVKPVVKTVQKTLSKVDLTYSTGVNVSGTPSAWIFNGQIGVSMDTKGNVGFGTPGKEFHVEWGTTVTLPYTQFNVYEVARSVYIKIMEW